MSNSVKIIIGLLLVSNLILIGFLVSNKPTKANKRQHVAPKERISKALEFDKAQIASYEELIENHKNEMRAIHEKIKGSKTALYANLNENNPAVSDSLIQLVSDNIKQMERLHYTHFLDIKNLCNEEQKIKFNAISQDLESIFSPKRGPKQKKNEK